LNPSLSSSKFKPAKQVNSKSKFKSAKRRHMKKKKNQTEKNKERERVPGRSPSTQPS
jgi:hypothetical protein